MTPHEQELITQLFERLQAAAGQPKDREAATLIQRATAAQPDAPYQLVQTVLIQDMALQHAQQRIADLERQLADQQPVAPQQSPSFLGGAMRGSAPPSGPWGRPQPAAQSPAWTQSTQPQYAPPPQPGYGQPYLPPGAGSGFLRQAATTAAGVVGGALLFEGIQSLFGPHYGSMLGGMPMQPGISETVINNYYGDSGAGGGGGDYAASQDSGNADGGTDYASDDVGGTDFGNDDTSI